MLNFKKELKRQGNKNFTFVRIRTQRVCSHCLNTLSTGTECLTVNPRRGSRRWYCEGCIQLYLNVQDALSTLNSTAFDDEGADYANMEYFEEMLQNLEEARG